jgi:glycosyltransferase involved in cell wall biosynthesis
VTSVSTTKEINVTTSNHNKGEPLGIYRLADLPSPPVGKAGWPWNLDTNPSDEYLSKGLWPKITVITPSYNQGGFLEQTIRSILLQQYPNLEYRIIDGGSTDGSVEIIKKYGHLIPNWSSARDRGQVDALNRGMSQASGEILTWINSDDFLLPGSLFAVAELRRLNPDADIITGARLQRSAETGVEMIWVPWQDKWPLISVGFAIFPQEATFFSRRIWELLGSFDESFQYDFDGVFFSKATSLAKKIIFTATPLGGFHAHRAQKSLSNDPVRVECDRRFDNLRWASIPWRLKPLVRLCFSRFSWVAEPLLRIALYRRARRQFQVGVFDWANDKWTLSSF